MIVTKEEIIDVISETKMLYIDELHKDETAIIFIDMVKGFFDTGALSFSIYKKIVPNIVALNELTLGYDKVFINDGHTENCLQFKLYPTHCIKGSEEAEIIEELITPELLSDKVVILSKNSENGFFAPGFKEWLDKHDYIKNFIIVGVCIDIGIACFAITLKTFFNEQNKYNRIIVPIDCVETYELGSHTAESIKKTVLIFLKRNGMEVVRGIE